MLDPPENDIHHINNNTSLTTDMTPQTIETQANSSGTDSRKHLTMMLNNTLNELDLASVLGVEGDTGLEKKLGASTETSSYVSEGEIPGEGDSEGMRLRCLDLLKNIPSDDSLFSDTEIFGTKQEIGEEVKQEKRSKKEKEPKPKKIKKSNPLGVKEIEAIQSPTHSDTFVDDIKQLHRACQYGQVATVSAILEGSSPKIPHIPELGEDIDAAGNTSLHIAAQHDQLLVLKILLRHCTGTQYITIRNNAGFRASQQGSRRTTRLLQLFEERWSLPSTSLRQAVLRSNYKKIVETELGLLHDAAVRDDPKMVRHVYKLDKSALDVKWHGRTALHDAALIGSCDAITALLNLGSDPAIRDTDGKQPFQLADKLTRRHFRKWSRRNDQRYVMLFDENLASTGKDSSSSDEEIDSDNVSHGQSTILGNRESRKLAQALSIINKHSTEIKPVKRKPGRPRKHPTMPSDNDDSDEAYQEKRQHYVKQVSQPNHEYIKKKKQVKREKVEEREGKKKKKDVKAKSSKVIEAKSKSPEIARGIPSIHQSTNNVTKTHTDMSRLHPKMKMKMMHRASINNAVSTNSISTSTTNQPTSNAATALLELSNDSLPLQHPPVLL